jgi:hypothetical protein
MSTRASACATSASWLAVLSCLDAGQHSSGVGLLRVEACHLSRDARTYDWKNGGMGRGETYARLLTLVSDFSTKRKALVTL